MYILILVVTGILGGAYIDPTHIPFNSEGICWHIYSTLYQGTNVRWMRWRKMAVSASLVEGGDASMMPQGGVTKEDHPG